MVKGTCMKDRKEVDIQHPTYSATKRGTVVIKGTCPLCGGKVARFAGITAAPPELQAKIRAMKSNKSSSSKSPSKASKKGKSGRGSHKSRKRMSKK